MKIFGIFKKKEISDPAHEADEIMKSKDEIIRRAMCLLIFADRCFLEKEVLDGVYHSLKEREDQRQVLLNWIKEKEYYPYLTANEKRIMETPVIKEPNDEAIRHQNDYECIEPLLWAVGLVKNISDYEGFVNDNLHTPMQIGGKHTYDALSASCEMLPEATIRRQRELAMLWYWRCLECRSELAKPIDVLDAVKRAFGKEHVQILREYEDFDIEGNDFVVNGELVSELNDYDIAKLEVIAERRFYAFEWMFSTEDWDEVDLVC